MDRFTQVVLAFVLGVAVGGFGMAIIDSPSPLPPDPENPPYHVSTGGSSCLDGEIQPHGGWVHEVASGRSYSITSSVTIAHASGTDVDVNVTRLSSGHYALVFETWAVTNTSEREKRPGECTHGTTVNVGLSLPTDYDRLTLFVNGVSIKTIENVDTTADLYQLPNPINATTLSVNAPLKSGKAPS